MISRERTGARERDMGDTSRNYGLALLADLAATLAMVAVVGGLDYVTGIDVSFSVFYLIPIGLLSWRRGVWPGLVLSLLCAVLWYFLERLGGLTHSHPAIDYWNAFVRGAIFLVTTILLARLRVALITANQARDAAVTAARAQSDFLAAIGHDIRTPLTALLAIAGLMEEARSDGEIAEYLAIFQSEGQRLVNLINDLLDQAKIDAGRLKAEKEVFQLQDVLDELAAMFGPQMRAKGLDFSHRLQQDVPRWVFTDQVLLKRILINLVANAHKFTARGAVSVKASRHSADPVGMLLFSVADTGCGIPEAKQASLFEPFSQVDPVRDREHSGSGLGLAICKNFVELLGGQIWLEDTEGAGSTFRFTLPLEPVPATDGTMPLAASREDGLSDEEATGRPVRILLVDDYQLSRHVIKAFLKNTPYQIDEAEDGRSGLEMFAANPYDLVLMDIRMPVMDGTATAAALREWERERDRRPVPIIALTASPSPDSSSPGYSMFTGFLDKVFTKRGLIRTIRKILAQERSSAEKGKPEAGIPAPTPVSHDSLSALLHELIVDLAAQHCSAEEALRDGDFEAVRAIGHKVRGAGGLFRMADLATIGRRLEKGAAKVHRGRTKAALRDLKNWLDHPPAIG